MIRFFFCNARCASRSAFYWRMAEDFRFLALLADDDDGIWSFLVKLYVYTILLSKTQNLFFLDQFWAFKVNYRSFWERLKIVVHMYYYSVFRIRKFVENVTKRYQFQNNWEEGNTSLIDQLKNSFSSLSEIIFTDVVIRNLDLESFFKLTIFHT